MTQPRALRDLIRELLWIRKHDPKTWAKIQARAESNRQKKNPAGGHRPGNKVCCCEARRMIPRTARPVKGRAVRAHPVQQREAPHPLALSNVYTKPPKEENTMIRKPEDFDLSEKKIRMLLAGPPGIGKSTLAMSAPDPLLIDTDGGFDRVMWQYRKDRLTAGSYQEILNDLVPQNLRDYKTLVIDTAGQMQSYMSSWVIAQDPKNGQRGGALSQRGYGLLKREFNRLVSYMFTELQKNIIIICHSIEEKEDDVTKQRLKLEGGFKNDIWEPMDLGGFIEIQGRNRVLSMANTEKHFGKCTHGLAPEYIIPELANGAENRFLTDLFAEYNSVNEAEAQHIKETKDRYATAMEVGRAIIAGVTDAATANEAVTAMKEIPHALTSEREIKAEWAAKVTELGLIYDKAAGQYVQGVKT